MFPRLEQEEKEIIENESVNKIFDDPAFSAFNNMNVLPLVYDEKAKRCNIPVFDYIRARDATHFIARQNTGKGRKHPVYIFFDAENNYICEVRYGGAAANALQRGLWTNTRKGLKYFDSITNGWIDYSHNLVLVKLFSHALVSSGSGHKDALEKIKEDISLVKQRAGLPK